MQNLKPIDKKIVMHVAEVFINKNGFTTTLEIKCLLREEGYYAVQDDISLLMDQLQQEIDVLRYRNVLGPQGYHREYYFERLNQGNRITHPILPSNPTSSPSMKTFNCYDNRTGSLLESDVPARTRAAARWQVAQDHGISYNNVRATQTQ